MAQPSHALTPIEIRSLIYHLRGKSVMLDGDLATLYGVSTSVLNQAVRRNAERFPEDFMFQLDEHEYQHLRSQVVISSHGGRRYLPNAFTEQGVAMLSSVLHSTTAIQVNIQVMRAFVQMRRLAMTVVDLRRRIDAMERHYDRQFKTVFQAMRELLSPAAGPRKDRQIGFGPTSPDRRS
jgi:hypothetical protein